MKTFLIAILLFSISFCPSTVASDFNSMRIAYYNFQDNKWTMSQSFLERAKKNKYTHIMVEFYVTSTNDWNNGRYRNGNYTIGDLYSNFNTAIAPIRASGLEFIPVILVPGVWKYASSWEAVIHSGMQVYELDDKLPCIASGLIGPDGNRLEPEGFERSFIEAMKVLEAACANNNYNLPFINLGYSECYNLDSSKLIWGTKAKGRTEDAGIDIVWMKANRKDVTDLVIASINRRIENIRSDVGGRLASAKLMIYGDMFSAEFQRALNRKGVATTSFTSNPEAKKLADRVVIIPWWYESRRLDGRDFDTETMFREFTGNGFSIIYLSCITDTDRTGTQALDVLSSRIPQLFECIEVANYLTKNILGFASAHWDMTGYDNDICWNSMEFLAYGNRAARPQPNLTVLPAGRINGVPVNSLLWSKTETTQGEYLAITGKFPFVNNVSGDLSLPAENVTFFDAILYCNYLSEAENLDPVYNFDPIMRGDTAGGVCKILRRLKADTSKNGYRLPSPDEWKYAYTAGVGDNINCYWADDNADKYCWNRSNSQNSTHPVGRLLPNRGGLYDMGGNVDEWVVYFSDGNPITAVAGGSYINRIGEGRFGTSGIRDEKPERRVRWIGFRVVRKAPANR